MLSSSTFSLFELDHSPVKKKYVNVSKPVKLSLKQRDALFLDIGVTGQRSHREGRVGRCWK
jgi:hypothetical protein